MYDQDDDVDCLPLPGDQVMPDGELVSGRRCAVTGRPFDRIGPNGEGIMNGWMPPPKERVLTQQERDQCDQGLREDVLPEPADALLRWLDHSR